MAGPGTPGRTRRPGPVAGGAVRLSETRVREIERLQEYEAAVLPGAPGAAVRPAAMGLANACLLEPEVTGCYW